MTKYREILPSLEVEAEAWEPSKGHPMVALDGNTSGETSKGLLYKHDEAVPVNPGDYVIIYPTGLIDIMPKDKFEASFEPIDEPKTRKLKEKNADA